MAQRLVRKICPKCKKTSHPPAEVPPDFGLTSKDKFHRGEGCEHCRKTGFRGRLGLYELLVMNDEVAQKIMERAPSPEIVTVARKSGLTLLREDGWKKVRGGVTTVDEVITCTAL